jgi:3-phosphoshikimate 1-carboxyvinyltransferase
MTVRSSKSSLRGSITVPGAKSQTIRAVLLSTLCKGKSVIRNPLPSLDAISAMEAARAFGAETVREKGVWTVTGPQDGIRLPENYIDTGNSGSVAYFAASMAALLDGYTFITGDEQIRRRPIKPLLAALRELGAEAFTSRPETDSCPVIIRGPMKGGAAHLEGLLSQYVTSILMSAPLVKADTEIFLKEPGETPYLDMTLDWMKRFGVPAERSPDFKRFFVKGGREYTPCDTTIASDWSGVAFPAVAAIISDSEITIDAIDFNDTQGDKVVIDYLIQMGANITKDNKRLIVKGGSALKSGLRFDLKNTPDALPALSVAAAFAEGDTVFTGLAAVRLKETDRVQVMSSELGKMGALIENTPETMTVHGGKKLTGTVIESHNDHRVAMAMLVCGFAANGVTTVRDADCAAVSFPGFFEAMEALGASFETESEK